MAGVFINYRGRDSRFAGDLLHLGLSRAFGADRVFLDSESIPPGADYVATLLGRVRDGDVVLAVIGPHWLTVTNPDGRRALDDPADWIRRELVTAFAAGVLVIPVLTDDAVMPTQADLPPDLARLGRSQYLVLRQRAASTDLARIERALLDVCPGLARTDPRPAPEPPPRVVTNVITGGVSGVVIQAGSIHGGAHQQPPPPNP